MNSLLSYTDLGCLFRSGRGWKCSATKEEAPVSLRRFSNNCYHFFWKMVAVTTHWRTFCISWSVSEKWGDPWDNSGEDSSMYMSYIQTLLNIISPTVIQLLFVCEKFLLSSREPYCRRYFSPETSVLCNIVVIIKKQVLIRLVHDNLTCYPSIYILGQIYVITERMLTPMNKMPILLEFKHFFYRCGLLIFTLKSQAWNKLSLGTVQAPLN